MADKNYYKTTSLALAAAIVATSSAKLSHIESGHQKATFVFERSPHLDQVIERFWQKNLPIDCQTYFEALRYVKSRLYEGKT